MALPVVRESEDKSVGNVSVSTEKALSRIVMVMTALTEGVDQAAATRIFGHHPSYDSAVVV